MCFHPSVPVLCLAKVHIMPRIKRIYRNRSEACNLQAMQTLNPQTPTPKSIESYKQSYDAEVHIQYCVLKIQEPGTKWAEAASPRLLPR